jgi:hypothetical protein
MVMIVIAHLKANPSHGYDSNYTKEGEPNPWLWQSLPTGKRTQSMVMIVITHLKANLIHGYDSHYPLEGDPNPWLW